MKCVHMKHVHAHRIRSLLLGLATLAGCGIGRTSIAQDEPVGEGVELAPVTVTGTRMKRVDQEDLQPLIVISREDLQVSGRTSVGAVLANLAQNSFGAPLDHNPTTSAPGTTTAGLRGLGAQYTLVLLNGIPLIGQGSLGGDAQNLNVLPWAAVDRIEILGDGASAVYGSSAVGGVINVITRRDFSGAAVTAQVDRPTASGADAHSASAIAGFHDERSQAIFSIDYSKEDPLFARQRSYLPPGMSSYGAPPTWRRDDPSPEVDQTWHASADCPQTLGSDPRYPNSALGPYYDDYGQFCQYNFQADAELRAALERKTLLAQGSTAVGDTMNAHALLLVSRNRSRAELAPAPTGALADAIPADSPFNPTLGEVAPGLGYSLDLAYRPVPAGPRISRGEDRVEQLTAGLGGTHIGAWEADWNLDVTGTRYAEDIEGTNFASISRFLDAISAGTFDPFADPATQDFTQFRTSISSTAVHRTQGASFQLQPRTYSLFDVPLDVLVGLDYAHESLATGYDDQQLAGDVFGGVPATPVDLTRNHHAAFTELALNNNGRWQLKAALRRDDYSDAGGATSPKLSAMWRATDALLLRASIGKGFHVPDLVTLGAPTYTSESQVTDLLGCQLRPDDPIACGSPVRELVFFSNPKLGAETARQSNIGAVFSPTRDFSVGVQGFRTHFDNAITQLDMYTVLFNDIACHDAERTCDVYREGLVERDGDGEIARILVPQQVNAVSSLTRGFDVDLRAGHDFAFGRIEANLSWSRITRSEQEFEGSTNAPLGYLGYPRDRANLGVAWQGDAWSASAQAHMIGSQRNCDSYDFESESCALKVPTYTTLDLQLGWRPTAKTQLAIGAINAGDRRPFINYNGVFGSAYSAVGRVFYLRVEQGF